MKKKVAVLLAMAMAAGVLSGCGGAKKNYVVLEGDTHPQRPPQKRGVQRRQQRQRKRPRKKQKRQTREKRSRL